MTHTQLKGLIIIVCLILIWYGVQGISTGKVKDDGGDMIDRDESPKNYWLTVGIYLGLGTAGIIFATFIL